MRVERVGEGMCEDGSGNAWHLPLSSADGTPVLSCEESAVSQNLSLSLSLSLPLPLSPSLSLSHPGQEVVTEAVDKVKQLGSQQV